MMRIGSAVTMLLSMTLFIATAFGAETGSALRNGEIKAEPYRDAKTVATINKGDRVEILKRERGWFQVKRGKVTGWVRMLTIRRSIARRSVVAADDVVALASGRAGTGRVVATTGIRGLNDEELKNAKFSGVEVKKVESFIATPEEGRAFAGAGKLVAQKVDYLPSPD